MRLIKFLSLLLFFWIVAHNTSLAQKQNNVWHFGYRAGLDFNTDPPTAVMGAMDSFEGCASIADKNGNLLFYTNGETVWDRIHRVMPNGTGLKGLYSSTQEALIIPKPNSCTNYYVFSNEDGTGLSSTDGGMYYTEINMLLNDGFGDVVVESKNTFLVDSTTEKLMAVWHENGIDIWVITSKRTTNKFMSFLVTASGVETLPVVSSTGWINNMNGAGHLKISNNRKKITAAHTSDRICELFDFDKGSGEITNPYRVSDLLPARTWYSIEFSPNDSMLYLGSAKTSVEDSVFLYQVDLDQTSLAITELIADDANIGADPSLGAIQLAPDGKIYIARQYKQYLDVIHYPNLPGVACQVEKAGIFLLPNTYPVHGLPNPAPYSFCFPITLGIDKNLCEGDSLTLSVSQQNDKYCGQNFSWYDGSADTTKIITEPGTYWIEVNNLCNITYRDSIRIGIDSSKSTAYAIICEGENFEGYGASGTYLDTIITSAGCDQIRTLHIQVLPVTHTVVDRVLCLGDTIEGYSQTGTYLDTLTNSLGCDSIRTLNLNIIDCPPIIHYDLNACRSVMADGSHMDYSEFTPAYPITLECAEVTAEHLYRVATQENKHSCTQGVNFSPAMCVTSFNSCQYESGQVASVIIEFIIVPDHDSIVRLKRFDFYEKSPTIYSWINGPIGVNNTPRFYGIRILKNGTEVFLQKDIKTYVNWTLQSFDFRENEAFVIDSAANFRIELLAYCPIGNSSDVSAWDLDEIKLYGECIRPPIQSPVIDGIVTSKNGKAIMNASVFLSHTPDFNSPIVTMTNTEGYYKFEGLDKGKSYFIKVYKNDDVLNGVSAVDLISIQKHLLGVDPFSTLDQFIAADANSDGRVNAMDLIEILKLLLGKYNEFPNNSSWRFGVLPQDMTGDDIFSFIEVKSIESLVTDRLQVDFLGIKIGDLNGDAK